MKEGEKEKKKSNKYIHSIRVGHNTIFFLVFNIKSKINEIQLFLKV